MAQQTAVEWLLEQIHKQKIEFIITDMGILISQKENILKQAKQMEKEQIERGYFKGHCDGYNAGLSLYDEIEFQTPEQYYNEKYNQ